MLVPTLEDRGGGQGHFKRQRCNSNNGVPISTRYEASTITTYYVSYYTPPSHSVDPPETTRPAPTSRVYTAITLITPRPQISIRPETSTTYVRPGKSVVSTGSDIIPKVKARDVMPVTITRTIVTNVPVETIYSCPPSSHEPPSSWSSSREPPNSSHELPTSWVEPTSRSGRPTSWWTNTTMSTSTRHWPPTSSEELISSTPDTPTSRSRPTAPPSTSPPPSTRTTSTIPPPTSSAPNSTTIWPPITTTPSYSQCVYTLFDGTVPYHLTAPCRSSTTSQSLCTRSYRNGEWDLVPCTSSYTNTSSTSTLTNTTTSTQTITSWPCSSYVPSWEAWVGVPCTSSINTTSSTWPCTSYVLSGELWYPAPCTSTMPNTTTSTMEQCSTFLGSPSGWAIAPCTSTSSITSTPTITTTPTPTITPTYTYSESCSTYVEDLKTWLPMPCNTITTTPTIRTIPIITETPTITRRPSATHTQHCSTYIWELEIWVTVPCNTPTPTRSMCLNVDEDMWVPCTSMTRTSDTDTLSQSMTGTSDTIPIFITSSRTLHTRPSHTRPRPSRTLILSATSTESGGPTSTDGPTQTPKTETHTPTHSQVALPSSHTSLGTTGRNPTSRASPSSSRQLQSSNTQGTGPHTTRGEQHSSTPRAETTRPVPTATRPTSARSTSTRPLTSPSPGVLSASGFVVPSVTSAFSASPTSTITLTPGGIRNGALAGVIVGSILGAIGLLGLGAFLMKAFGGNRGRDLFAPRGGYEAASGGGSGGGRDEGRGGGGSGGGGGGSGGMNSAHNESPLRSALRNRDMAGGGEWRDASWSPIYAYTGLAAAAAAAATTSNNQHRRDSEANGRYADGGIRDEDTPDAVPQRYGDGGLTGPDSYYDTGVSNHPYGNQDIRYIVSNSEVQFDPYRDLPVHQDIVPVGGNIARESAYTTPEFLVSPPGPTSAYHSTPTAGNIASGHPGSTLQPPQAESGVFMSAAGALSTTSFAPSSVDQGFQSQTRGSQPQSLPPYAQNIGVGGGMYQSPQPLGSTDIQRPPYWEGSIPAASVDSLPQHGNIPRYSAFTDVGSSVGVGSSSAPGFNNTLGVGGAQTQTQALAPPPAPGIASMLAVESAPQVPDVASPTWNPVGVTEFGQNVIGSSSAQPDATTCITGSDAPDGPKGLHPALTRLTTELASAEGRDIDALSRSPSQTSTRPPRVGGPRMRPPRNPARLSIPRPESGRSLPPAYEEHPNT